MKNILSLALAATVIFTGIFTTAPQSVQATNPSPLSSHTQPSEQSNSYNMIRTALLANDQFGAFDPTEISTEEVAPLIQKVLQENPEILYYKSAKMWKSGKLEFFYHLPADTIKKHRAELTKEIDKVLKAIIKPKSSDFDKVKAIHDYLVLNTAYDYENQQKKTIPANSYTAHGSLINGIAVCDGYTKAAQIMLNRLGIENNYIVGQVKAGLHSWNQVKINGQYYFMDITWDDPAPNKPGLVSYNYFLVTSEQLRKDHTWDEKKWPVATSKQYSYFSDFRTVNTVGDFYYYSSKSDKDTLYRMTTDGKNKKKISDLRAPYFAISGDWIYFSNYSSGGHLYKMKTDGSNVQRVNSIHSVDISLKGNILHFTNNATKKPMTFTIK